MKEIGGYIEFPQFDGNMFHEKGIALNLARNCLSYIIESRRIKKLRFLNFCVIQFLIYARRMVFIFDIIL